MTEETINKLHELLESKRSLSILCDYLRKFIDGTVSYNEYRTFALSMDSIPIKYKYELGNLMCDYLKSKIDELNNQIEML